MNRHNKIALLLTLALLTACREGAPEVAVRDTAAIESLVRTGDLVFRRGRGLTSRLVLAADRPSAYSHTGIVVRDGTGWRVVHAVPGEAGGDRVKMEPLSVFFQPCRAEGGAVMRVQDARAARNASARAVELFRQEIPFDHDYDLSDTSAMYCTELIHHVFTREGLDLTGGRRTRLDLPGFAGEYILPGDLQQSTHVTQVTAF